MPATIRAWTAALIGVHGYAVEVQAHIRPGLPTFHLDGVPQTRGRAARDRVRAAVINSGPAWPEQRISVSLLPHSLPKRGTGFDLAIAVAVLAAAGLLPPAALDDTMLVGELGLDGRLHPVPGVLPAAQAAESAGQRQMIVSQANAPEAWLLNDCEVHRAAHLTDVLAALRGEPDAAHTD